MHGCIRKKFTVLLRELGRKCFVVRDDERWLAVFGDNICHREGFSGAGHAKEGLLTQTLFKPFREAFYRKRLISRRLIFAF